MRSVDLDVLSEFDADDRAIWRTLAKALANGRSQLATRHALRCLTGNWGMPDQVNWQLQQQRYTEWLCPKCAATNPSTPHLIHCWVGGLPDLWWQALAVGTEPAIRKAAMMHRRLQEAVMRTAVEETR